METISEKHVSRVSALPAWLNRHMDRTSSDDRSGRDVADAKGRCSPAVAEVNNPTVSSFGTPNSCPSCDSIDVWETPAGAIVCRTCKTVRAPAGEQREYNWPLADIPETCCDKCGGNEFVDVPIHDGQSIRRDCKACDAFYSFVRWYGEDCQPPPPSKPKPCFFCGGRTVHSHSCEQQRRSWIVMPAGKYKGTPVSGVPQDYLAWFLKKIKSIDADVRDEIKRVRT